MGWGWLVVVGFDFFGCVVVESAADSGGVVPVDVSRGAFFDVGDITPGALGLDPFGFVE